MTHILVATLGTTPQVLTEAFCYYHRHLGITFDEIHVFTTSRGADTLKRAVFGSKGAFARMCRDLRVRQGSVKFGPQTVHVMLGADGTPIEDVRTTADGDAVADQMLTVMRQVCADPHTTVHAIASGGRKVMSIYLHAMMQLVGRPQDKLFHILVHPALEAEILKQRRLDFFYPNGPVRIGRLTISEEEVLAYIEIPLLSIAPRDSLNRNVPYTQMARERQQEVRRSVTPPTLTIDPRRRELRIDEISIALTPDEFFWYYSMARLAAEDRGRLPVGDLMAALQPETRGGFQLAADPEDTARLDDVLRRLQAYHRELFPNSSDDFQRIVRADLMDQADGFTQKTSRINRKLRRALHSASKPYETRRTKLGSCGIDLSPDKIRILAARKPINPPALPTL